MNEQQAVEILKALAEHFEVCVPKFRFNRARRGLYYKLGKIVTIAKPGPRTYWGTRTPTDSLLHEFAHHLADERFIKTRAAWHRENPGKVLRGESAPHHDNRFRIALLQVTTHYFGNPAKYSWDTEYRSIKKWAEMRGLLIHEPTMLETFGHAANARVAALMNIAPMRAIAEHSEPQPARLPGIYKHPDGSIEPFSAQRVVELYSAGTKVPDIAVAMGYQRGHGQNRVRTALIQAGVYKKVT